MRRRSRNLLLSVRATPVPAMTLAKVRRLATKVVLAAIIASVASTAVRVFVRKADTRARKSAPDFQAAPAFSGLQKSTGIIYYRERSEAGNGCFTVSIKGGATVGMRCDTPTGYGDVSCAQLPGYVSWQQTGKHAAGNVGTAWWVPLDSSGRNGRLYQLAVGDDVVVSFEEMTSYYESSRAGMAAAAVRPR